MAKKTMLEQARKAYNKNQQTKGGQKQAKKNRTKTRQKKEKAVGSSWDSVREKTQSVGSKGAENRKSSLSQGKSEIAKASGIAKDNKERSKSKSGAITPVKPTTGAGNAHRGSTSKNVTRKADERRKGVAESKRAREVAGDVIRYAGKDLVATGSTFLANGGKNKAEETDYKAFGESLKNAAKGKKTGTYTPVKTASKDSQVNQRTGTWETKKGWKKMSKFAGKATESALKELEDATKNISDKKEYDVPELGVINKLAGVESTKKQKKKARAEIDKTLKDAGLTVQDAVKGAIEYDKWGKEQGFEDDTLLTNGKTWAEQKKLVGKEMLKEVYGARTKAYEGFSGVGKMSKKDLTQMGIQGGVAMAEMLAPYIGTAGKALKGIDALSTGGKALTAVEGGTRVLTKAGETAVKNAVKSAGGNTLKGLGDAAKTVAKSDLKTNVKREILANALQDATIGTTIDYMSAQKEGLTGKDAWKYLGKGALFNAALGAPIAGIAGRTGRAGKAAINEGITDSANAAITLSKAEGIELGNLIKKADNGILMGREQERLLELQQKAFGSEHYVVNSKGKIVQNNADTTIEALSREDAKKYLNLQAKQASGTLRPDEIGQFVQLQRKVQKAYKQTETVSEKIINLKTLKSGDLQDAETAVRFYERTGDEAKLKVAQKALEAAQVATKNLNESLDKAMKIMTDKTGIEYKWVTGDEMRAMGASEDSIVKGFTDFDKNGKATVYINRESPQAWQAVVGHETMHLIKKSNPQAYKELADSLEKYVKEIGDYDELEATMRRNYPELQGNDPKNMADFREEMVSEMLGRYVFGEDDKFIKRLAGENPTALEKMVDYIKNLIREIKNPELADQFNNFLKSAEDAIGAINKDEVAKNAKGAEGKKSVGGKGAVGADADMADLAVELKGKGFSNNEIQDLTGWYVPKDGEPRFRFSDKGYSIKQDVLDDFTKPLSASEIDALNKRADVLENKVRDVLEKENANSEKQWHVMSAIGRGYDEDTLLDILEYNAKKGHFDPTLSPELRSAFNEAHSVADMLIKGSSADKEVKLGELINHEELFKYYPKAKDVKVKLVEDLSADGVYDPAKNTISLKISPYKKSSSTVTKFVNKAQLEDNLLHEIQHAIQKAEGFASGSNAGYYEVVARNINSKIQKINDALLKKDVPFVSSYPANAAKQIEETLGKRTADKYLSLVELSKRLGYEVKGKDITAKFGQANDNYARTLGEMEARDAEKTRSLSNEELRKSVPKYADDEDALIASDFEKFKFSKEKPANAGSFNEEIKSLDPDYTKNIGTGAKFSKVANPETLKFLDDQEKAGKTVEVYRAMVEIDGKFYPPMATKIKSGSGKAELQDANKLGEWVQADEHPELLDKDGKFVLRKDNGTSVPAAYNPYIHTSFSPLNDQFTSAYKRPNLVVVKGIVPESELTSGYKATGAKDSVGKTQWHSGVVAGQLPEAREVMLSRWFKPQEVVSDAEVAKTIKQTLGDTGIEIPYNVVTPSLRRELEKIGVPIGEGRGGAPKEIPSLESGKASKEVAHRDELLSDAEESYGAKYTEDFNETGFIFPDGKLPKMGDYGQRAEDHNVVISLYDDIGYDTHQAPKSAAMGRFLDEGNIRIMPENGSIEMSAKVQPTSEQYSAIRRFLTEHDEAEIEFSGIDGRSVDSKAYSNGVNAEQVINDIKRFYSEGKIGGSDLNNFRYSKEAKPEKPLTVKSVISDFTKDSRFAGDKKAFGDEVRELAELMRKDGLTTDVEAKVDDIIAKHIKINEYEEWGEGIDPNVKSLIKSSAINISELGDGTIAHKLENIGLSKADVPSWVQLRSAKGGRSLDSVYHELSDERPDLFPPDASHEDKLLKIIEASKQEPEVSLKPQEWIDGEKNDLKYELITKVADADYAEMKALEAKAKPKAETLNPEVEKQIKQLEKERNSLISRWEDTRNTLPDRKTQNIIDSYNKEIERLKNGGSVKDTTKGTAKVEKTKVETPEKPKKKPAKPKEPEKTEVQKLHENDYVSDNVKTALKDIDEAGDKLNVAKAEKIAKRFNDLDKKIGAKTKHIENAKKSEKYATEAERAERVAELEDELATLKRRQAKAAGELEQLGKMKAVDPDKTAEQQIKEMRGERKVNKELKSTDNLTKTDNWIKDKMLSVRRLWEDSLIDVEKTAKASEDMELRQQILTAANRVRNSHGVANNWITNVRSKFDNTVGGKSLDSIFNKELIENEPKYADFQEYLIMKHVPARHAKGTDIYPEVSPALAEKRVAELEERYGKELTDWADDVYDYIKDLQQYRVDSGMLSKEAAEQFEKDYPFYVPTNRVNDESGEIDFFTGGISNGIRSAKGGDNDVLDIYSQLYTATNKTIHAAEENQMLNLYFKAKGVTEEQLKDATLDDLEHAVIEAKVNKRTGASSVSFFVDGKPVRLPCNHQLALGLRELDGLEFERLLKAAKVATLYGKPFKALVTDWNLVFGVRNGARDLQQALVNSKDTRFFASSTGAAAHAVANADSPFRKLYASMGGERAQLVSYDAVARQMGIEKQGRVDAIHEKVQDFVDFQVKGKHVNPIHYVEGINGAIEMMPRMCEFIGTLRKEADTILKGQGSSLKKLRSDIVKEVNELEKAGKIGATNVSAEVENRLANKIIDMVGKDTIDTAMRNANDITLNFGRSGVLGKALNMGFVPYLNPSIQGLSKLVRLFSEAGQEGGWKALASIGMKLGTFTIAPAVLNEVLLKDNEDYQNLNTRDKDNNFFIPLDKFGEEWEGKFLKFPKPRENAVLAEPVEYGLRYFLDDTEYAFFDWDKLSMETEHLWEKIPLTDEGKQAFRTAIDNIGVINPATSNMLSPLVQTFQNKTWYGGKIESAYETAINDETGKANVPVNKRYDTGTSGIAIKLGQTKAAKELNLSPKKIDNILDSYTGMIYDLGISQTTEEAKTRGNWLNRTIASQFVKDSVFSNKLSTNAWGKMDGMTKKEQDAYKSTYMYDTFKYDDAMDLITGDKNLTNKQKMDAKRALQIKKNKLNREAIDGKPNTSNPLVDIAEHLGATKTLNHFLPDTGGKDTDTWADYFKTYKNAKGYSGLNKAQKEKQSQKFLDVYTLGVKGQLKQDPTKFHDSPSWGMSGVAAAQLARQGKLSGKDADLIMKSCGVYESQTAVYHNYAEHGGNVSRYAVTEKRVGKTLDKVGDWGMDTKSGLWKGTFDKSMGAKGGTIAMSLATSKKVDFKDRAYYIANSSDPQMMEKMNAARGFSEKYGHKTKEISKLALQADALGDSNTYLKNDEIINVCNQMKGNNEEKAMAYVLLGGKPGKNPFGAIGNYAHDGDTGIQTLEDDGSGGGHGRRRRRGRRGHGGGGGGSKKGTMPKTESGAIKGKVSNPFSNSNGSKDSNLNDAYRKKVRKLRKELH